MMVRWSSDVQVNVECLSLALVDVKLFPIWTGYTRLLWSFLVGVTEAITMFRPLFRLREVADESPVNLGPVNLGVDHLIVDNPLLPRGHDLLSVEPQRVEAWMECRSPLSRPLPLPSFGQLSFIKDVTRRNDRYYLED